MLRGGQLSDLISSAILDTHGDILISPAQGFRDAENIVNVEIVVIQGDDALIAALIHLRNASGDRAMGSLVGFRLAKNANPIGTSFFEMTCFPASCAFRLHTQGALLVEMTSFVAMVALLWRILRTIGAFMPKLVASFTRHRPSFLPILSTSFVIASLAILERMLCFLETLGVFLLRRAIPSWPF
ncbi:hypothetical protein B0T26DRAFT_273835 [Lasiosphaeria miniovina]|uniref:Uncharacterized protein n=1 Tax=Lasiosphaeria miniovina TaxID=1954250 RepID=A0AA40DZ95_9PEZI|nr:uncharacterized protein B0T26DRAFT_273835 [Lasiosphaeria miniovina]KAK0717003.1 hypothetical protein B0T26DRAFT_273835 [Lasiosphaeria miniovina]